MEIFDLGEATTDGHRPSECRMEKAECRAPTGRTDWLIFSGGLVLNGLRLDRIGQSSFSPELKASTSEFEAVTAVISHDCARG